MRPGRTAMRPPPWPARSPRRSAGKLPVPLDRVKRPGSGAMRIRSPTARPGRVAIHAQAHRGRGRGLPPRPRPSTQSFLLGHAQVAAKREAVRAQARPRPGRGGVPQRAAPL